MIQQFALIHKLFYYSPNILQLLICLHKYSLKEQKSTQLFNTLTIHTNNKKYITAKIRKKQQHANTMA